MDRPSLVEALAEIGEAASESLAELLERATFGVYIDDPTRGCIYANDALLEIFALDWASYRGYGWAHALVPEDVERIQNAISGFLDNPEPIKITYRIQPGNDGPIRWICVNAKALLDSDKNRIGTLCLVEDVTEKTHRSARQIQEQKMEAVGQLAARLAHDLNNLLTAIIGNTELLALEIQSETGRARLENIEVVFEQARNLTSQLLTLSKGDVHHLTASVLDLELGRLSRILKSIIGGGVELAMSLNSGDSVVALSFSQLGQIMLNLSSNARDAMEGKGTLLITSSKRDGKVVLTVQDTGCGMAQETVEKSFTPFFTTKEQGRGSGLGLTTVQSLTELVSGEVKLDSSLGAGTTVTLTLPIVESLAVTSEGPQTGPPRRRSGTVLIVEDNNSVRQSLAISLSLIGYQVCSASSLAEARQGLAECGPLVAVVSDVQLPDGLGTELLKELRQRWPQLPVVFNSGFTGAASQQLADLKDKRTVFVAKPFRARDILQAIDSLQ